MEYDPEHDGFSPDSADTDRAFDLIANVTGFFDDEEEREVVLRPILERLLVGWSRWEAPIASESTEPRGVWLEGLFTYLIIGMKNEPGLGGLVVIAKSLPKRRHHLSHVHFTPPRCLKQYLPFITRSNLPVVLLAITGVSLSQSHRVGWHF